MSTTRYSDIKFDLLSVLNPHLSIYPIKSTKHRKRYGLYNKPLKNLQGYRLDNIQTALEQEESLC